MLYCGPSSGNYPTRVDAGNTDTHTITTLQEGATSVCAVTAYDPARVESGYSDEIAVFVPLSSPVAGFSASPKNGTAPLTVAFSNQTTSPVTGWAWNFGDGTTSALENPSHVYSKPGTYNVTLTATGPGGTVSTTPATAIQVTQPAAITVGFTFSPASGPAPLYVRFTNTTIGKVTSWRWDFGDGWIGTRKQHNHRYMKPGTYTVVLTATGPGGTVTKTVQGAVRVGARAVSASTQN